MIRIAEFLATAGYVGYIPFAPGTFGSAVGLMIYAALQWAGSSVLEASVIVATLLLGVWSADVMEKQLGKDPHPVVIDEVAGMLITLAFLDVGVTGAVIGFLVFRLFDVIKPWPAGRLEHLHGGPGVMLDDAMAGLYSHLVVRGSMTLLPAWFA